MYIVRLTSNSFQSFIVQQVAPRVSCASWARWRVINAIRY